MFVDNLRKMLIAGQGGKSVQLSRRYSASYNKCSGFLDKSAEQVATVAEIRDEAWNRFYDYCTNALRLIILNGRLDLFELEDARILVEKFLSVLFPDKDYYAAEICSRLNYVAKCALESARTIPLQNMPSPDSYSPMDSPDSFRQMLSGHLEQSAELNRGIKQNRTEDDVDAVLTKLLEITFEQSRYQTNRKEYARCESRYDSCLRSLRLLTRRNVVSPPAIPATHAVSLSRPVWLIRAALKDYVHLPKAHEGSIQGANLTWSTVSSIIKSFDKQIEKSEEIEVPEKLRKQNVFSRQNTR